MTVTGASLDPSHTIVLLTTSAQTPRAVYTVNVGTGMATINRRSDQAEYASSGSMSIGGIGAFWETWRVAGHLAIGPYVAGTYENSDSISRIFGMAGIRAAVYGGP